VDKTIKNIAYTDLNNRDSENRIIFSLVQDTESSSQIALSFYNDTLTIADDPGKPDRHSVTL